MGRELSEADFRRTFGMRNDAVLRDLLGELPPAEVERLAVRKEELFRRAARGNIVALPGALALLRLLRERGFRLALVSSTPYANIELMLRSLGVEADFDVVVAGEDVTRGKPNPEGFLLAAERLGVKPAECVVIEDAQAGVEAAKRGGMRCVGVCRDRPRERAGEGGPGGGGPGRSGGGGVLRGLEADGSPLALRQAQDEQGLLGLAAPAFPSRMARMNLEHGLNAASV